MRDEKINYKNGGLTKLVEYIESLKKASKVGNNFSVNYKFEKNSINIEIILPKSLDKKIVDEVKKKTRNK